MSGIYIHIPFCRKKCYYCNFFSIASSKYKIEFVQALFKEIDLQKTFLGNDEIETIYFGGGTPSFIDAADIRQIIMKLYQVFYVSKSCEITIETNPEDINTKILSDYLDSGINRLSIGIQSFNDEDLIYLGRNHTAQQAKESLKLIAKSDFENISIDLIYGIPTLSNENWKNNIEEALKYNIQHISAYCLTIEPNTILNTYIQQKKSAVIDDEKTIEQYYVLKNLLKENEYEQYEISNFCKPGYYSKHNTSYWLGKSYLGLGPAAHSYNINNRYWNINKLKEYIDLINLGNLAYTSEELTPTMKFNEYILTRLRTKYGIDLAEIKHKFGLEKYDLLIKESEKYLNTNDIMIQDEKIYLTDKGELIADKISSDLFC